MNDDGLTRSDLPPAFLNSPYPKEVEMTYAELLNLIHNRTWVPEEKVRDVLETLADVLRTKSADNEQTRTPLGVFYMHVREGYPLALPDGTPSFVPEQRQIRLKPGTRLKVGWSKYHRPANLNKLVSKAKKPIYNPVKKYLDEDDELLEESY